MTTYILPRFPMGFFGDVSVRPITEHEYDSIAHEAAVSDDEKLVMSSYHVNQPESLLDDEDAYGNWESLGMEGVASVHEQLEPDDVILISEDDYSGGKYLMITITDVV